MKLNLKKVFRSALDTAKENLAGQIFEQPEVKKEIVRAGLRTSDSFVSDKKYQIMVGMAVLFVVFLVIAKFKR